VYPAACWKVIRCLGFVAATAAAAQTGEPPPLALPNMEVKAKAPPEKKEDWRYASVGNFEVLAKPSDQSADDLITALQEFDHAVRLIFPAAGKNSVRPLAILLTYDRDYRDFASTRPANRDEEFSEYFHAAEQSVIVVNKDASESMGGNGLINFSSVDSYRQLSRQYLRHLFAGNGPPLPPWLTEGLAQTITDMDVGTAWLTVGKVITNQNMPGQPIEPVNVIYDYLTPNPALSGLSFKEAFSHRSFLPLDQMFTARLPDGSIPSSDSAWAKQAYAFVHFCLFGNKLRYRAPLLDFVGRLQTEALSEPLFTSCFGVNYARMLTELRGYLLYTKHQYQRYDLKPGARFQAEPVKFREAADDEIALLKGGALQLAGNDAAARETYRQAYLRGVRTPDYLAAYAAVCFRQGDADRARELISAALKNGTRRPSAHVLQAQLQLKDCLAAPAGQNGKLDDAQLATVLQPLFAARQLPPPLPEVYLLIAEAWAQSESLPKAANLAVLDEGIRQFPRHSAMLIQSIELYRRIGDGDKVTSIAKLGWRAAGDEATKAYFAPLAGMPVTPAPKF
jgi:hypothetical protein